MPRYFSFQPGLEIRDRKFKGVRGFAGKPFHPPLTDVTVGAYVIGPVVDLYAWLTGDGELFRAGAVIMLIGAITSSATVLTGFFDWLNTQKGTQVRRMVNSHAWTMVTMTVFVLLDLLIRFTAYETTDISGIVLVLDVIVLGLVTIGGTLGGALTYDWGFNVEVAKDHPVWHENPANDYVHPHDEPKTRTEI